jgi:dTDP-4-dehydrorhamnose 3,5-epimerase
MLGSMKLIASGGLSNGIEFPFFPLFSNNPNLDNRGEFTRIFDVQQLAQIVNRNIQLNQVSFSYNYKKFTRRGLHVRNSTEDETKFVRILKGSVLDLILDCRVGSNSFGSWALFELHASSGDGIIVPGGFAHGIQTLENDTIVCYGMEIPFDPKKDLAINTDDLELKIPWGNKYSTISIKDKNAQSWQEFASKSSH